MQFINKHNNSGFSLIEVLIAVFVLAVGIFSLYSLQVSAINGNSKANLITSGTNWAGDKVEEIMQMDYEDLVDLDSCNTTCDRDGTDQDADGNGVDDDAGNFGLDDTTAATADGSENSPDGIYSMFWNVAVDYPMENSTTIRIYTRVNNRKVNNMIVMNYIRNNNI